jgi:hypothetical protein
VHGGIAEADGFFAARAGQVIGDIFGAAPALHRHQRHMPAAVRLLQGQGEFIETARFLVITGGIKGQGVK